VDEGGAGRGSGWVIRADAQAMDASLFSSEEMVL
jgi:hypothetical protein